MMKLIALVKKKPGLSRLAFKEYWLGTHIKLSTQIPGMRGYRINIALEEQEPTAAPFDGSAEIWWDSVESFRQGNATAIGVIAAEDTQNFCESVQFIYTEEHTVMEKA